MDRGEVEVYLSRKKERGRYPAILTEQAWPVKDLLYSFRGILSCGAHRVVPSGQDSSTLPARGATIKEKSVDTFDQNKRFLSASIRSFKKTSFLSIA